MSVKQLPMEEVGLNFTTTRTGLSIYPQVITPKLATQLINSNHEDNRRIKPKVVQSYKRQMEKGLWHSNNGEGIKISDTNRLIDGQHRLAAIIEYGKPVEMLIISGIPEVSITSIDDGARRTLADAMMINGKNVPNQSSINSALNCLMTLYNCGERHYSASTAARTNSTSELIQFFDSLPNFKETAAEFFTKFRYTKVGKIMPLGLALPMYYLLKDYDEQAIFMIFKSYETGIPMDDLREASPIYHVCERARRARELKVRIMPWDHIMSFLWVFEKIIDKKRTRGLPSLMAWQWNSENPITQHAINKLQAIKL